MLDDCYWYHVVLYCINSSSGPFYINICYNREYNSLCTARSNSRWVQSRQSNFLEYASKAFNRAWAGTGGIHRSPASRSLGPDVTRCQPTCR